jgi:hypothetical protein
LLKDLGWSIGVRFHYGLTNVYKNISNIKNHALFVKLNISIGVSEAKKEAIKEVKNQNQKERIQKIKN